MVDLLRILVKTEHHRVEEMISAYMDGELSPEDRARVERHLDTCADCAWNLWTLRQTVDMLGRLPSMPVPRPFTISEAQIPEPTGLFQWIPYSYLKGATALVALLLVLVLAGEAMLHYISIRGMPALAPAKQWTAPTAVVMREGGVEEAGEKPTPASTARVERAMVPPTPTPASEEKGVPDLTLAEPLDEGAPLPPPAEQKPKATAMPALEPHTGAPAAEAEGGEATPVPEVDMGEIFFSPPPSEVSGPVGVTFSPTPSALDRVEAPVVPLGRASAPAIPRPSTTPTSPPMTEPPLPIPSPQKRELADVRAPLTTTPSPLATPTTVAKALLPTSPPPEVEVVEGVAPRPRGLWLTPLRCVEFILLFTLIILIAVTLIVGRRRDVPR